MNNQQLDMSKMTPMEALNVLNQASGLAPLNRQEHVVVQQAVQVLKRVLNEVMEPEREEKKTTKGG